MILAIKRSIEVANKSYSATRYHRRIEYIERIDEDRIHIQMTSPESINPVRCITNLSRAFLKDATSVDHYRRSSGHDQIAAWTGSWNGSGTERRSS